MKKKSEKFNICTFCLSKMCKLLGVWAVAWLLSIQVSRFAFRSRGFSKPLLHPAYVFQNMKSFTGRSYLNSTLFKIALQESLSLLFVCLKIYTHYYGFQLQLGYKQIKSVRYTLRLRDFPKTLLHLAYVFQNIKLE